MITSVVTALAALAVAVAPAAEPPPPYDWDGVAVPFKPFYAFTHPGGTEITEYAIHPAEGRAVCAWAQQYAELGPLNCLVAPMEGNLTYGPNGQILFPDGPPAIEIAFG
jgi:hypothetical protein